MLMSRVICQTNWNSSFYVVFQSIISQEDSRGPLSVLLEITKFLVLYLVILWMSLRGETFHAYPRLIPWTFPQFIINASYARARAHTCPHTLTQGDLLVQAGRAF